MPRNPNVEAMYEANQISHRARAKQAPKEIRSIEIEKAENGGHTVTHRFQHSSDGPYHEAENHVFGQSEGSKLMSHLKEHLGIEEQEAEGDGEEKPGKKSAAGAAY